MPEHTPVAFISYSREDSDFALRLAQDLKAAGADVWLDQLDIEAGHPWDNAIEGALNNAPKMLLILSPSSAKSENVRNEISYALEVGKIIIPVLYMDCVVPLRLQRTQRIDFRADYARGLKSLLANLNVTQPDPVVLQRAAEGDVQRHAAWKAREAEADRLKSHQAAQHTPFAPPPIQPLQAADPAKSYTLPIAAGAVLLVLILLFAVFHHGDSPGPSGTAASAQQAQSAIDLAKSAETLKPPVAAPPSAASAPPAAAISSESPAPADSPNDSTPTAAPQSTYACVFDPVSNIRVEPSGSSTLACSIDTIREIQVNATPTRVKQGVWWQTNACGTPGYIANNQVHVGAHC